MQKKVRNLEHASDIAVFRVQVIKPRHIKKPRKRKERMLSLSGSTSTLKYPERYGRNAGMDDITFNISGYVANIWRRTVGKS